MFDQNFGYKNRFLPRADAVSSVTFEVAAAGKLATKVARNGEREGDEIST